MAAISGHARAQVDLMLAGPSCATPCLVKADCAAQGAAFDCCGGGCVDVTSTAAHCGGCGMACSNENATPTCVASRCVATCAAGFGDCNGDARTDGCEIDLTRDKSHCGACATGCPSIAGTDIECMSSICTVVTCPGTSVDCNHMPEDGCEADLMKDDAACGDCATSCVKPSHCTSGICNRFAFASSVLYHGDFGSVAVADGNCQALATAAGLPGTYKAWLADSDLNTAPGTRFNTASPVPIIDVQGSPIAQSYSDLVTNQQPAVPLDYSEKGTPAPSGTAGAKCAFAPLTPAWTNVGSDGRILMTGTSCTNWSTQTGTGNVGDARARSAMWTDANCPANCSDTAVLYCFQQ
jgi:hypothetical protein